jgi:hypothetical protein
MKHYDSIDRIQDDGTLLGEDVWAFNKLDGQNFAVKYNPRKKIFDSFGSRKRMVDETDEQFGDTVRFFKASNLPETLIQLVSDNSKKKGLFTGVDEITFYFEWYGEHSFCGFHQDGDEMHLALIDVFLKKKGYIEPKPYYEIFCQNDNVETPELIYHGTLTKTFVDEIYNNDWTKPDCKYPMVKEGVVCRRSSLMKGQRMPKVKFKTKWWLDQLHAKYSPELWKELE